MPHATSALPRLIGCFSNISSGVRLRARVLTLLWIALWVSSSGEAWGHTLGLSKGDYRWEGGWLTLQLTFAEAELLQAVQSDPTDRARVQSTILDGIEVSSGAARCPVELRSLYRTDQDGVVIDARARCAASVDPLHLRTTFVHHMASGHRHILHLSSPGFARTEITSRGELEVEIPFREPSVVPTGDSGRLERPADPPRPPVMPRGLESDDGAPSVSFLRMGVGHILSGADHLLFLLGLALGTASAGALLRAATAFTVGHSLSLIASGCGVSLPSAAYIEPLIALSIAYVAVDNLRARHEGARGWVCLPFGLLHGCGFAGALGSLGEDHRHLWRTLFLFNAGIEIGQVLFLVPVWLVIGIAHRPRPGLRGALLHAGTRRWIRVANALLQLVGIIWFGMRVVASWT